MALTIKNPARLDYQTRRMDLACNNAFRLYFYPAFGKYDAVKFAGNDYVISFDLPFHSGSLTEDQAVTGNHISFYMRVDAEHAGGLERSLESHALVQEAGKFMLLLIPAALF
jgi:hypothetical protein